MKQEWREATQSGDIGRIRALLDEGADINSLDEHGQTALINAVYAGSLEVARLLVQRGADLDRTAKYRLTALMLAVINQRHDFVRLLVDAGANSQLEGSYGSFACTPLEYAEKHKLHEIALALLAHT